jgi:hypothetical protein
MHSMRQINTGRIVTAVVLVAVLLTLSTAQGWAQPLGSCIDNPLNPPGTMSQCQFGKANPAQSCQNVQTCVTKNACVACYPNVNVTCPNKVVCHCCKYTAVVPYGNCAAPAPSTGPGCAPCQQNLQNGPLCAIVCATGNACSDPFGCAPGGCTTMVCACIAWSVYNGGCT